jgi:hypothetical protein
MSQNEIIDVEAREVPTAEELEQIKAELNHPSFKKWFRGLLHETTVNVTFTKANGDKRHMVCTLKESDIPYDKRPKSDGKAGPEDSVAVFDLEKFEWRSFRFDSIEGFDWQLDDKSEYPTGPEPVYFDEDGNEIIEEEETDGQ